MRAHLAFTSLLVLGLLIMACQPPAPTPSGDVMPDFSLTDVNPASSTHEQQVSVRSLQGRVSAWYFTHTT